MTLIRSEARPASPREGTARSSLTIVSDMTACHLSNQLTPRFHMHVPDMPALTAWTARVSRRSSQTVNVESTSSRTDPDYMEALYGRHPVLWPSRTPPRTRCTDAVSIPGGLRHKGGPDGLAS